MLKLKNKIKRIKYSNETKEKNVGTEEYERSDNTDELFHLIKERLYHENIVINFISFLLYQFL